MNIVVNDAVTDWNNTAETANTELKTLEDTLKSSYNNYIDSLAAYLQKIKDINTVREKYIRIFESEDMKNDTRLRVEFLYSASESLKNNGNKYILDNINLRDSYELVMSESVDRLLSKKVI
jgi:hypothetical protein